MKRWVLLWVLLVVVSVIADEDGSLQVISAENAAEVVEVNSWSNNAQLISNILFHPDGDILAVVDVTENGNSFLNDGEIHFLDPSTLAEIELTNELLHGTSITFSPDGSLFAVGSETGELTIYDFEQGQVVMNIPETNSPILSLAIDSTNSYLAATFGSPATIMEGDSGFKVFNISSGDEYITLPCINMTDFGCDGLVYRQFFRVTTAQAARLTGRA